ncbi:tRNA acetyltransferase TAN1 [Marchantia polymorpha subsp. ruderalis]|uniref:THUMP domain-containing protein n=2 Tax=Marchantia polymorpha TaxID=3197 RepID=A0AAF6BU96_MARPO|nr:hypothetical protein MARPO_0091s0083 [Marchantia polymorpha]BBN15580.1 hypothetical protein Mp_6g20730 [Marchantia polymorpha subsp. ruderalis]|eukprot:PTQ33239.1 hypothetical protein MARPO_0091s0083 [Marchantia polymorpha]
MAGENQNSGKSNKRKKRHAKYLQHGGKKSTISSGVQGFLITCVGGKERQSIKEAISLLDQFFEKAEVRTSSEPAKPSTLIAEAGESLENEAKAVESKEESTTTEADAVAEPGVDDEEEGDASDGDGDGEDEDESEDDAGETLGWVKSRRLDESGKAQASARAAADPQKQGSDQPKGSAAATKTVKDASRSFDELLADELSELRDKKKARFVGYETGCNGVIFVRMHVKKGVVESKGPMELAEAIVRDAASTKQSKTRHCMRLLPVELTCYASTAEMLKVAEPLIQRHFPADQPSIKFAVVCEARANTNLKKMDFINAIAKLVPEPHSVDLSNPQKTILVQVVKTACAIGVVQDFKELAKYNLRQLTTPDVKSAGRAPAE